MKAFFLFILSFLLCVYNLDAFLSDPYHLRTSRTSHWASISTTTDSGAGSRLTHHDLVWKLRPPPDTPLWKRFLLRLASNAIRLDCLIKRQDPPFCLCPRGGQAVLEAYLEGNKIGRFGITTLRGPPAPIIDETVQELFDINLLGKSVGSAAIIYMFVEPSYRQRGVGELALEVISVIHALQDCDFTLLVADDDGSGKLVRWYERYGFQRASKLQDFLGSPNQKYGVTMVAPTNNSISPSCRLQWW